MMRIVLVSSEGDVMPLIEKTSSHSRSAKVCEILDLGDSKAVGYLIKRGIPSGLAKRLKDIVGGRFIFLQFAVEKYKQQRDFAEDDIFEIIRVKLQSRVVPRPLAEAAKTEPFSGILIKQILENGPMTEEELVDDGVTGVVIHTLVRANMLRYQADHHLTSDI